MPRSKAGVAGFKYLTREDMRVRKVKGYFISTCGWCKKTKRLLDDNNVDYEYEYVDLLKGDDKARALAEVSEYNPRRSFPTVVLLNDDTHVVIGYKEDRLREVLGL
jgi:glutaredoxin-like protein NrdH